MTTERIARRDPGLRGRYVGFVTRFEAFFVDLVTIGILFWIGGHLVEYIMSLLLSDTVRLSNAPLVSDIALVAWAFLYCTYPLAVAGHTFGMAVLGIRAVRTDGGELDARHAVLRVLAFPLSFLLLGFGFLLILLRRDRRALHDLIARTSVVYAWDAHGAHLHFLAKR